MGLLPDEVMTGKARVVLMAGEGALVEQHRGLISYETDNIRFRVKGGQTAILGKNLVITSFGAFDARVQGEICQVQLTEEEA